MFQTKQYSNSILDLLSGYDIFRKYFDFTPKRITNSPFRRDSNPSFIISQNPRTGDWQYTDFGTDEWGNSFQFVQKLFGLTYFETLNKIAHDFNISPNRISNIPIVNKINTSTHKKETKEIKFSPRKFTQNELDYWKQYHISLKELEENEIFAINKLWIDSNLIPTKEMQFAYRFTRDLELEKKKIYSPDSKYKWIGNISTKHVEGLWKVNNPTSDYLIIGKSRKDRICLDDIHSDVINTQNENYKSLPEHLDSFLQTNYKKVFIFWDNDKTGVVECTKLNKRGYYYLNIPKEYGCKDISDLIKLKGKEAYLIIEKEMKLKGI